MKMLAQNKKLRSVMMSAPSAKAAELPGALQPSCRKTAALALSIVRDGVITGEGPTTKGRIHFSRALDADDAAWCARILTAVAVEHQPVCRAEVEALFEINAAAIAPWWRLLRPSSAPRHSRSRNFRTCSISG